MAGLLFPSLCVCSHMFVVIFSFLCRGEAAHCDVVVVASAQCVGKQLPPAAIQFSGFWFVSVITRRYSLVPSPVSKEHAEMSSKCPVD